VQSEGPFLEFVLSEEMANLVSALLEQACGVEYHPQVNLGLVLDLKAAQRTWDQQLRVGRKSVREVVYEMKPMMLDPEDDPMEDPTPETP
jgi:hypothetical protein